MKRVSFDDIDPERFHVNRRSIDGLGEFVLVVPRKAMWSWNPGEEHLRSLLCRPDGAIVSSGFPKFYNYSEDPSSDRIVEEGMAKGHVSCLEKVDGTLIIRSVIDGHVHFRTRGCELIASDMRSDVLSLINDRYPLLLDPNLGLGQSSLLMEYVGPRNQVVVRYGDARLYALGWSDWSNSRLRVFGFDHSSWPIGLERLRVVGLPDDVSLLRERVSALEGEEGIVTWTRDPTDGSYSLCKFKSGWYLRLHALRSQATPRYLREFCYLNDVTSLDDLKASMMANGFDWEVVSYLEPMFDACMEHRDAVTRLTLDAETMVTTRHLRDLPTRKDKALAARQAAADMGHPELFNLLLRSALQEFDEWKDIRDAMLLDTNVQRVRDLKRDGIRALASQHVGEGYDDCD